VFRIYPAVDIKEGRCVRLLRGDMDSETVYGERPWEMALRWQAEGASYLHVVDLDGAVRGRPVNLGSVREILERVRIPVQVGGGVRTREDVERLLDLGASRVILGTRALVEPAFLAEMVDSFGERVIPSLDTRGREVAVSGWTASLRVPFATLLRDLVDCGVKRLIHTDIRKDGTLAGHGAGVPGELLGLGVGIIAAGGISSLEDLQALKRLSAQGVEGAVVGKALYAGVLSLPDILELEEA